MEQLIWVWESRCDVLIIGIMKWTTTVFHNRISHFNAQTQYKIHMHNVIIIFTFTFKISLAASSFLLALWDLSCWKPFWILLYKFIDFSSEHVDFACVIHDFYCDPFYIFYWCCPYFFVVAYFYPLICCVILFDLCWFKFIHCLISSRWLLVHFDVVCYINEIDSSVWAQCSLNGSCRFCPAHCNLIECTHVLFLSHLLALCPSSTSCWCVFFHALMLPFHL